jgi:hypothetical protein
VLAIIAFTEPGVCPEFLAKIQLRIGLSPRFDQLFYVMTLPSVRLPINDATPMQNEASERVRQHDLPSFRLSYYQRPSPKYNDR